MKIGAIVALCALLCASAVVADNHDGPIECEGKTECTARVALNIRVSGLGSCQGTSAANCVAFADSTAPCIAENTTFVALDECAVEEVTAAASCYAAALAAVFAEAYVAINCEGNGQGCGFAHANGEAWACSFAAALAEVLVDLGGQQAACEVTVESMAGVFAAAAADAQAEVCAEGNFAADFESNFAVRIETIIAQSIASCFAACDEGVAVAIGEGAGAVVGETVVDDTSEEGETAGGAFELPFNPFADDDE